MRSSLVLGTALLAVLSGCVADPDPSQGELAMYEFIEQAGDVSGAFPDAGHALAYALATDCLESRVPETDIELAVREACTSKYGILSDLLSMTEACAWIQDQGADSPSNSAELCG